VVIDLIEGLAPGAEGLGFVVLLFINCQRSLPGCSEYT
jgi:hypothetical protein